MKVVSNFKNLDIELELDMQLNSEMETVQGDSSYNSDSDEEMTTDQLIACVNTQFEMLYQANHKRKYLLKEISSYLVRR